MSHEFGLCIYQGAQGDNQISDGRADFADGSPVLSTLFKGLGIELSHFQAENVTLQGDYLRQVVEILIGGGQRVFEICVMCLIRSLGKILLQSSVSRVCSTQ